MLVHHYVALGIGIPLLRKLMFALQFTNSTFMIKMFRATLLFTVMVSTAFFSNAENLPRSASFGVMVGNLNDSLVTQLNLPTKNGTHIRKVFNGSSASNASLKVNDVIVTLDGKEIADTKEFLALLKNYHGGDKVKVGYYRKSKLHHVTMKLQPKPMEQSDEYEVIYSSVHSGENHLRTIITKPEGEGPYPAVLMVGGVGCYSIDNTSHSKLISSKMWIDSLTVNGFVTLRVEKTGMGDSKGIPCKECDFHTEKQGYFDGIRQLRSLSFVDTTSIFIAGFSMGGVIGPLIAAKLPVKGIIAYGTAGKNWFEYELENTRRQRILEGYPADSLDLWMRNEYKRLYGLFVEKRLPDDIMSEHPETTPNFFNYPMRIEYFQQVADIDIGELWMRTTSKVLVMHGSSDFVSSADEHALIADVVNRYHPGNATYTEIPDADHWEIFAESEEQSMAGTGRNVNPGAVQFALSWLEGVLSK